VGCVLLPLRGWFYLYTFLGCIYLCRLWLGFGFSLGWGFCGHAGGGARATRAYGGAEFGVFDQVLAGVVGDFAHHRLLAVPVMHVVETNVFCVPCGDAQGLDDQPGAGWVESAFQQAVDYVHDRKLDGLAVFEQGHGVQLHVDALLDAFDDTGVEIAEELAAQGGRSAALSGDFDVSAITNVGMGW